MMFMSTSISRRPFRLVHAGGCLLELDASTVIWNDVTNPKVYFMIFKIIPGSE